jgi:hypothetical protein
MPRAERVAKNQALTRALNEQISEAAARLTHPSDNPKPVVGFFCECGTKGCRERVQLTTAEYERIRLTASTFVVVPGHEIDSIEQVLERTPRFFVVQEFDTEPAPDAAEHTIRQARLVPLLAGL